MIELPIPLLLPRKRASQLYSQQAHQQPVEKQFRFSEDSRRTNTRYQEYTRFSHKEIIDHPKVLNRQNQNSYQVGHYNIQPTLNGHEKLKRRISTAGNSNRFPKDFFKLEEKQASSTKNNNHIFNIKRNLFEEFMRKKFQSRNLGIDDKQNKKQPLVVTNENQLTPKFKEPSPKEATNSTEKQSNQFLILQNTPESKGLKQQAKVIPVESLKMVSPFLSQNCTAMIPKNATHNHNHRQNFRGAKIRNLSLLKKLNGGNIKKKGSNLNFSHAIGHTKIIHENENERTLKERTIRNQNKENIELPVLNITKKHAKSKSLLQH